MEHSVIIMALLILAGGVWRRWDGGSQHQGIPSVGRVAIAALICGTILHLSFHNWYVTAGVALFTAANLQMAVSKFIDEGWEDPKMMLRYSLPALAVGLVMWNTGFTSPNGVAAYTVATALGGAVYPIGDHFFPHSNYTEWAEWAVGITVIGGLSLLVW